MAEKKSSRAILGVADLGLALYRKIVQVMGFILFRIHGPCKTKPILYVRASDYCTTGKKKKKHLEGENKSQYIKADFDMWDSLPGLKKAQQLRQKRKEWSERKVRRLYPGWNLNVIEHLRNVSRELKYLEYPLNFRCVNALCRLLGDRLNTEEQKKKFFTKVDRKMEGVLSLNMLVYFLYNLNQSTEEGLKGLAKATADHVNAAVCLTKMPFGERLEFGVN